jgi:hypothetical protein
MKNLRFQRKSGRVKTIQPAKRIPKSEKQKLKLRGNQNKQKALLFFTPSQLDKVPLLLFKLTLDAFILSNTSITEIVLNNPGISPTEVMKKLGESWKDLSESEKYEYETMAADDKIRYHQEVCNFARTL